MALAPVPEHLSSWKDIARYLGRDQRTVQRWETECALPVHRTPGRKRGSVFAYPHELDAWLASRNEVNEASPAARAVPAEVPISPVMPRRPRYFGIGLAFLLLTALVVTGMAWRRHESDTAIRIEIAQARIIGIDHRGQRRWEYHLRDSDTGTGWRAISLPDKQAFIVTAAHNSGGSELDCLTADGAVLWRYEPKLMLKFGSQLDNGPWSITSFDYDTNSENPKLWAAVADSIWGHSFIAEIDLHSGHSQIRFVNNGALLAIRSVRQGDRPYLLAGGFNNEFDLPALAVLDPSRAYGVSPQTPGTRFYCENCGQGSPQRYFVLPRSELNQLIGQGPNLIHHIDLLGSTLHVSTSELSDAMRAIYFFSITPEIRPQSVTLASTYWTEHRKLEREGRLKHSAEKCDDYLNPKPIRLWTPESGWSEVRVEYIPKGGIPEK